MEINANVQSRRDDIIVDNKIYEPYPNPAGMALF
jgi:hypothetical protein